MRVRFSSSAVLVVLIAFASGVCAARAEVLGAAPTYVSRALSPVPNAVAITARIWAPGLDEGYVPQGLSAVGRQLYVSAYKSTSRTQGRGPCRLYRLDPATGSVNGWLDLPPSCGHAGGLAKGVPGRLFVSDTREVFEIELPAKGDASIGRIRRSMKLSGDVKGSFAATTADALWLGTFARLPGARLYKFPFGALKAELTEADAVASVPLPRETQGAAFDGAGQLWITRSGRRFGELLRLEVATGKAEARYEIPAGSEDLSFAADGRLWLLSEAGSRRWLHWNTFFPVVFQLDPGKLR
jgi:hypothetical protein